MHSVTYDAPGSGAVSLLALPQPFLKIIVQYKYLNYSHFVDLKKWKEIPLSFPKNWRKTLYFQAQILEHSFCGTNIKCLYHMSDFYSH